MLPSVPLSPKVLKLDHRANEKWTQTTKLPFSTLVRSPDHFRKDARTAHNLEPFLSSSLLEELPFGGRTAFQERSSVTAKTIAAEAKTGCVEP